jgi:hypothetical protein
MKQNLARALCPTLTTLFLLLLCLGLPFAWIMRDGLGSDSVDSSGLEAVMRCLKTFYIGPALGILAIATIGAWLICRSQPKLD